jgi:hypothetical protein
MLALAVVGLIVFALLRIVAAAAARPLTMSRAWIALHHHEASDDEC